MNTIEVIEMKLNCGYYPDDIKETGIYKGDYSICTENDKGESIEEIAIVYGNAEKYAKLFTVAPELLSFIKEVLAEQLEHGEPGDAELISKAQNLIAKVEGN